MRWRPCCVTVLMGFGSYALLEHYFESNTDEALAFRMAEEFQTTFGSLPAELARAKSAWEADHVDETNDDAGGGGAAVRSSRTGPQAAQF